ncbi:hypothetical protein PBRA_008583 [Plasmodiophora brassicae]|uniref:GH18 domain-containing protein n=1 Tax=Plasmodiophora brassicae TaxID=37360 RepID=A0A0G4J334_PLABS|nr:hypothetical protein PBRA_008583 [Plasmodiophora brassicae]
MLTRLRSLFCTKVLEMKWSALLLVYIVVYAAPRFLAAPQPCMNCSRSSAGPGATTHIIGYVYSYKTDVLPISGINGTLLTEIVYDAFSIVDGRCVVGDSGLDTQRAFGPNTLGDDTNATPFKGNFYQLHLIKQKPGNVGRLRTLISVGGWSHSTNLSVIASSADGRRLLASSCTQLARYFGFDGVELQWVYPVMWGAASNVHSPADKANLPLLLAEFKRQDPGLLLTAMVQYTAATLFPMYDLAGIADYADWIHVDSTFALWAPWSSSTAHYANLYHNLASPCSATVDALVSRALAAGVPPCKLIVGVPLSYPAWKTSAPVAASFPALFTSGTAYSTGATDSDKFRYRDAARLAANASASFQVVWDSQSSASVLYSPVTQVWMPIETAESAAAKATYIADNNLGGVRFMDLSGDTPAFDIVTAMQAALKRAAPCTGQAALAPSGGITPNWERQPAEACAPLSSNRSSAPALQTATRIVGRYTGHKHLVLPVAGIDGSLMTHIIYEAAIVNSSWQCAFGSSAYDVEVVFGANALGDDTNDLYHGNFNQLRRLKLKYPHLKTILQLGPDIMFSSLLSDPARQTAFVSSCVAMMQRYAFDGLNINWNSPVIAANYNNDPHQRTDRTQLPVLLQLFRTRMPPGALLTLTITPVAYADTYLMYDVPSIAPHVDFIEYKNEGNWSPVPAHLNPLHFNIDSHAPFSIDASIVQLLDLGVPRCKLVLGVPVYGVAWQLLGSVSGTSFYPGVFSSTGQGYATGATDDSGHYRYRDIVALVQVNQGAWVDHWDAVSQVPFLVNATGHVVISYENRAAIVAKAAYVKSMALGGFAIDGLDSDTMNFTLLHSAIQAIVGIPGPTTTKTSTPPIQNVPKPATTATLPKGRPSTGHGQGGSVGSHESTPGRRTLSAHSRSSLAGSPDMVPSLDRSRGRATFSLGVSTTAARRQVSRSLDHERQNAQPSSFAFSSLLTIAFTAICLLFLIILVVVVRCWKRPPSPMVQLGSSTSVLPNIRNVAPHPDLFLPGLSSSSAAFAQPQYLYTPYPFDPASSRSKKSPNVPKGRRRVVARDKFGQGALTESDSTDSDALTLGAMNVN